MMIRRFLVPAALLLCGAGIPSFGQHVPDPHGRGPAYQLPPLPDNVVYTLPASFETSFEGRSYNFAPQFFIYPDGALDAKAAEALVDGLGLPEYAESDHAGAMVINPVGEKYDSEADFEVFKELFNRYSRSGNIKVIGFGEGADFVNRVLLPEAADHIAGILTVDGRAVSPLKEKSYGVPAYVAGKNAARVAKAYIAADGAVACGELDGVKLYENPDEPLLRVAVSSLSASDLHALFADAWDKVFCRNYRFNNYKHTHYMGAAFGQFGPYELEPYMIPENFGIVRNVVVKERPGGELPWLWYEYWPEELLKGAPDRSVPVVVLLHGNTNDPRTQAETSGFIELAAEEKFFVVEMEWQGSRTAGAMGHDGVEAVLYELTDKYPQLDPSRIYCEGLSAGSITSTQLGIVKSHVFAAVGGHSGGLFGNFNRSAYGLRSFMAEAAQKRSCVEMPYCGVLGSADEVVPFYTADNYEGNNYLNAWNAYLLMDGLDCIDSLDYDKDPVFGFSLSDRETIVTGKGAGISMETGVIYKGEVPMMRLVVVNDYGHWNFKPAARLMWDFFRQFSRDQETFKLIYTPVE